MQIRIFRFLAIVFLAAFIISGCTTAPKKPDQIRAGNYDYVKEYITWLAKKEMKKNQVVGLSIAIVDDQRTVWAQGFGYADKKEKRPAAPETVYRIGSISKLFTVTATMQLAEEGKIDIDQPLKKYLPEFSIKTRFPDSGPITLRTIMTHHSGLPNGVTKGAWTSEPPQTLLYRLKEEYAAYPPNYVLSYSNAAMALLGLMIEQVSATEFCAYLEQSVFDPIGMQHSSFNLTPEIARLLSRGYRYGKETQQLPLRDQAAGSMYSNVIDLSRFIQMVFAQGRVDNRQILRPDTIDEMLRPQNETVTLDFGQHIGLGWFLNNARYKNLKIASHGGATPLFRTSLAILPQEKIGVVMLTNSTEGGRIHGQIANEALKLALEAKIGSSVENKDIRIEPPDKMASEEMLQSFVGRYATLNMLGAVGRKEKTLNAYFEGYKFRLIPSSNGQFGVERRLLGIFPLNKIGNLELAKIQVRHTNFAGRELLTIHSDDRHWFSAEKIDPLTLPQAWENALGKYKVINPDPHSSPEDISLSNKEGVLLLRYKFPLWYAGTAQTYLIPISETEAITLGIGRNSGETMRMIDIDGEKELSFWGYKLKKKL